MIELKDVLNHVYTHKMVPLLKSTRVSVLAIQADASDDSTPQPSPSPLRIYLKDLKTHSITRGTEFKVLFTQFS